VHQGIEKIEAFEGSGEHLLAANPNLGLSLGCSQVDATEKMNRAIHSVSVD
jgi:hypothetical protein